ncbi:hypothetical protein SJC17_28 [Bacteroides phage SJC17]|nr:hypothetical protein SJC11_28 [Bacteroides phage SJC11]QIG65301.1 hypothetical protein SJC16_28 [Bacteroides phage SJC16]QIG65350.1 hypothetical protein SJC17_28 [Bacteroides phage SJC17]QIG65446.1 hypothetical protein SJC20_28 [Bacteroides phage SJC20]
MEKYNISVGGGARSTNWKRKSYTWAELVEALGTPKRDTETTREYDLLAKSEKAIRKDKGGFVGGTLSGGRRTKNAVTSRSLITLDVDFGTDDFFFDFCMHFDCAAAIYGTRSDRPGKRRYRLIIPLSREIESREEYEAASRKVAEVLGIELFDTTTFQAERLMFWATLSSDQPFYFETQEGEPLDVDYILSLYGDGEAWQDVRLWAFADSEDVQIRSLVKSSADPTTKSGMIGAFCRVYTIQGVIEKYLSDVYEECGNDRYTYKGGTSAAGMVVYDNMFAYSHHSTDPIGDGHTYNAYDLVRVHLYGHLGKKESEAEMVKLMQADEDVVREMVKVEDYLSDFEEIPDEAKAETEEEDTIEWDIDSKGNKTVTAINIENAFKSDPLLNKLIGYDLFQDVVVYTRTPYFDKTKKRGDLLDDTGVAIISLRIERLHKIYNRDKMNAVIEKVALDNAFHPIKDYLNSLEWDFEPRLDKFMSTYMGSEDNIYVSEAFRKMLVAAVARMFNPGTKFDTAFIMVSHQGAGKSTLIRKLSKGWFNDSLVSMEGQKAYEAIQKSWLVELAELSALKKTDIEVMKNFISKTEDTYRAAYAKRIKTHKRQCVFFGSTNQDDFLKDPTGNRRFFPVPVEWTPAADIITNPKREKEFDAIVDQLWAEAVELYRSGESLILSPEAEAIAVGKREEYTERDPMEGLVYDYVNRKFPKDWFDLCYADRRDFADRTGVYPEGTEVRNEFCTFEIWVDCLGNKRTEFNAARARQMSNIMKRLGFKSVGPRYVKCYGKQTTFVRDHDANLE